MQSISLDHFEDLYAYNLWANVRILDAASRLRVEEFTKDLGSSFPSVRDTLAHILASEWIWLARWRGDSPSNAPQSWDLSRAASIRLQWDEVERDRQAFLAGLTEDALSRVIAYRNTKGKPFEQPLWEMLQHVVNHSTYHRGQVVTMLRQLGADAVSTDLILYYRERAEQI